MPILMPLAGTSTMARSMRHALRMRVQKSAMGSVIISKVPRTRGDQPRRMPGQLDLRDFRRLATLGFAIADLRLKEKLLFNHKSQIQNRKWLYQLAFFSPGIKPSL